MFRGLKRWIGGLSILTGLGVREFGIFPGRDPRGSAGTAHRLTFGNRCECLVLSPERGRGLENIGTQSYHQSYHIMFVLIIFINCNDWIVLNTIYNNS